MIMASIHIIAKFHFGDRTKSFRMTHVRAPEKVYFKQSAKNNYV